MASATEGGTTTFRASVAGADVPRTAFGPAWAESEAPVALEVAVREDDTVADVSLRTAGHVLTIAYDDQGIAAP